MYYHLIYDSVLHASPDTRKKRQRRQSKKPRTQQMKPEISPYPGLPGTKRICALITTVDYAPGSST